jgi:hypothetical protein
VADSVIYQTMRGVEVPPVSKRPWRRQIERRVG